MQKYLPLISRVAEPYWPDAAFGIDRLVTALERYSNASHGSDSIQIHTHTLSRIQSIGGSVLCPWSNSSVSATWTEPVTLPILKPDTDRYRACSC
jgi:hypothetical protein